MIKTDAQKHLKTPSKNPNNNNNRDSLYPLDGKAFFPFSRIQNTTKESISKRITSFLFHLFFIRDKNDEGLRNRKGELYGLFVSLRLRGEGVVTTTTTKLKNREKLSTESRKKKVK